MRERWQTYELDFIALAANGGQFKTSFQVETGYDFEIIKLSAFVFDANGLGIGITAEWPRLTCILTDGASNQPLVSAETPIRCLFGSGEIPYILPVKHRVKGGGTFSAQVFNRHTATVYNVSLAFSGRLITTRADLA